MKDLASAGATKRPPCCMLVLTKPTKGELGKEDQDKLRADYDQVVSDVRVCNRVAVVVAARFFVLALLAPPFLL
ncbi:hypothetical protein SADUNF_Sadunf10G0100200 [Salix dunnii]|uniref:Uncharacterized protein n=1 Tax=Salix dunnii TaxID=1413687 RepID=A0A835JN36_9ROSI|nr:hypothetical protein SADUNF_Sadunf10G0100200 [Salix dunnii]